MFKEKCTNFLDDISKMRESALEKSVQEALQKDHQPYVEELIKTKNALIAEENEKLEAKIKQLREEYDAKVVSYEETTEKAIEEDKLRVEAAAIKTAAEKYDKFILGVSLLIDETKID